MGERSPAPRLRPSTDLVGGHVHGHDQHSHRDAHQVREDHLTSSLPSRPLPDLVGPRVSLLTRPLQGIRCLHLEQIGDNVVKGEAIERQSFAVSSAGVRLHVPNLTPVLATRTTDVAHSRRGLTNSAPGHAESSEVHDLALHNGQDDMEGVWIARLSVVHGVARMAARVGGTPNVTITSTLRWTSAAARPSSGSMLTERRFSMTMFRPGIHPRSRNPQRKADRSSSSGVGKWPWASTPIR